MTRLRSSHVLLGFHVRLGCHRLSIWVCLLTRHLPSSRPSSPFHKTSAVQTMIACISFIKGSLMRRKELRFLCLLCSKTSDKAKLPALWHHYSTIRAQRTPDDRVRRHTLSHTSSSDVSLTFTCVYCAVRCTSRTS